jgi:hypothetical protein
VKRWIILDKPHMMAAYPYAAVVVPVCRTASTHLESSNLRSWICMKVTQNNFLIKPNKTSKQGNATIFHRLTYQFKIAVHAVSKHVD